jgi:hypothetical protein
MKKENLITCGCSFTKGHLLPETETWGGYTATKLNLNFHNISKGGMGNEWITQRVISYFLNNTELIKNSVVMIGWSEASRLMGTFENGDGYTELVTIRPQDFFDGEEGLHERNHWGDDISFYHGYVKNNYKYLDKFFSSFSFCLYKTYYSIYILKLFLESNNIPYVFFDAIGKLQLESIEWIGNYEHEHRYDYSLKYIHHDNKISEIVEKVPEWMVENILNDKVFSQIFDKPNYISFNGLSMLTYMFKYGYDKYTEGNPGHPNSLAADLFSDIIVTEYEKLYNNG